MVGGGERERIKNEKKIKNSALEQEIISFSISQKDTVKDELWLTKGRRYTQNSLNSYGVQTCDKKHCTFIQV